MQFIFSFFIFYQLSQADPRSQLFRPDPSTFIHGVGSRKATVYFALSQLFFGNFRQKVIFGIGVENEGILLFSNDGKIKLRFPELLKIEDLFLKDLFTN